MKTEWVSVNDHLPPKNMLVKVLLANGLEGIDFVKEPLDLKAPFESYNKVVKWRSLSHEDLNLAIEDVVNDCKMV